MQHMTRNLLKYVNRFVAVLPTLLHRPLADRKKQVSKKKHTRPVWCTMRAAKDDTDPIVSS